jgi:hypothetical protein
VHRIESGRRHLVNPAEGGRGFVIEQRGNTLFMGVFLYDSSGRPTWHAASGAMNGNTFSAALSTYANGQTSPALT